MILILSVLILPALLRLIVPATENLGAASGGQLAMAAAGALATGAIRFGGLHKSPVPARSTGSSAPDDDGGPSGAGVTTGSNPPSPAPSSSTSRTDDIPTPTSSPEVQQAPPVIKSPSSGQQPAPGRTGQATRVGTALAESISGGTASWRTSGTTSASEPSPDKTHPDPASNADTGPSGAQAQGDEEARENGG
jgi:hypothetical protein